MSKAPKNEESGNRDRDQRGKRVRPATGVDVVRGDGEGTSIKQSVDAAGLRVGGESGDGPSLRPGPTRDHERVLIWLGDRELVVAEDVAVALDLTAVEAGEVLLGLGDDGFVEEVLPRSGELAGSGEERYRMTEKGHLHLGLTLAAHPIDAVDVEMERAPAVADAPGTLGDDSLAGALGRRPSAAVDLLAGAMEAAAGSAWAEITGTACPSRAEVQAWLDRVHSEIHNRREFPGHLGSFDANARFAAQLRLLLQGLGNFKLKDPKTGLLGQLYHRRSSGCPAGRFSIKVTDAGGKYLDGETSVALPSLSLAPEIDEPS